MRYLILSDLHANWHALEAVLRAAEGRYDQALCCGDLVGYGADPNPVAEWVRAHCAVVVRGNHDRSCTGLDGLEWFNPVARAGGALDPARRSAPENADYIRALPQGPAAGGRFRGGARRSLRRRRIRDGSREAAQAFGYLERRVVFFGHTHVQGGFIWNHSRVETIPRTPFARPNRRRCPSIRSAPT